MKRFNSSKVRALGNLQPLSDKQKAHLKRANGIKMPFSLDREVPPVKKTRDDFMVTMRADWTPKKPRGRRGAYLSHEKRALILERHEAREKFFASL